MSGLLNQQLTALGTEYEMIKESEKFQVVIPQGVKTGGKFKVLVHGKHHILRCPQNKRAGEKHQFEIEIEKRVEKLPMATNITNVTPQNISESTTPRIDLVSDSSHASEHKSEPTEMPPPKPNTRTPAPEPEQKANNTPVDIATMDPIELAVTLIRAGQNRSTCTKTMKAAGFKKNVSMKSFQTANRLLKSKNINEQPALKYKYVNGTVTLHRQEKNKSSNSNESKSNNTGHNTNNRGSKTNDRAPHDDVLDGAASWVDVQNPKNNIQDSVLIVNPGDAIQADLLNECYEFSTAMALPYSKQDVNDIMYLQQDKGKDRNALFAKMQGGLHMDSIRERANEQRKKLGNQQNHGKLKRTLFRKM